MSPRSTEVPTIPPGRGPVRGELYEALLDSAGRGRPFPVRDIEALAGAISSANAGLPEEQQDRFASAELMNSYRAITRSVEEVYCSELLSSEMKWTRHLKNLVEDPRMGFIVASSVLATLKSDVNDIKRYLLGDFPGERGASVDDDYTAPLEAIRDLHSGVSAAVSGKPVVGDRWREALGEMEGLLRDAGKMLQAVEIKFLYLRSLRDAPSLSGALNMLMPDGYDRIDTIVSSLRKLHLPRASAYDIWMNIGWIPSVFVPENLRADLVRIMNELILNAIKFRDLKFRKNKKMERDIHLMAASDGPSVTLGVMDNGRGAAELKRQLRDGSGLTIASELAMRNGWRLAVESDRGRGASASLVMDTSGWGASSSSPPSGRNTLPAPGGADGLDPAEHGQPGGAPGMTDGISGGVQAVQAQQVPVQQPVEQIFRSVVFSTVGASAPYHSLPGPGVRR